MNEKVESKSKTVGWLEKPNFLIFFPKCSYAEGEPCITGFFANAIIPILLKDAM
jgi:hypothetical protein